MNKIHDTYDQIHADPQLIDSTQRFLEQIRAEEEASQTSMKNFFLHKTEKASHGSIYDKTASHDRSHSKSASWKNHSAHRGGIFRPALAVLAALILVCGIGGISAYQIQAKPVSYISIDESPSIELSLNRSGKVLKATAYNDDGQKVLDQINVTGKSYEDAVEEITKTEVSLGYLTADSSLVYTVMSDDDSQSADIQNNLITCQSDQECSTSTTSASTDIYEEAHDNHMSFGKYNMYLSLSAYDSSITAHDCESMSMEEICDQIYEHEHGSSHENTHDQADDASSDCNGNSSSHNNASSDCENGSGSGDCSDAESDYSSNGCSDNDSTNYSDSYQSQCYDDSDDSQTCDSGYDDDYSYNTDSGSSASSHDAGEHSESGHGEHGHDD